MIAITLHRVPEVLVYFVIGQRNGWITLWKEMRFYPLIAVGFAAGALVDILARMVLPI